MLNKFAPVVLVAAALLSTPALFAESISTTDSGTIILDAATAEASTNPAYYNTVDLQSTSATAAAGGQFLQPLLMTSGYDGVGGPQPFSFSENITVDGVTGSYLISGTFLVSPTADPDTLTFNAGAGTQIGDVVLTLEGLSLHDNPPFPGGIVNQTLTFDVTAATAATPEPSSFLLLGTGLISAVGVARKRLSA